MKSIDIDNLGITSRDLCNMFNVYVDEDRLDFNTLTYAINRSLFFKDVDLASIALFDEYSVKPGDEWPILSYRYYGTTELWWLICKINKISNPTIGPIPDTTLKLLKPEHAKTVLSALLAR